MLDYIIKEDEAILFDTGNKVAKMDLNNLVETIIEKRSTTSILNEKEVEIWGSLKNQLLFEDDDLTQTPKIFIQDLKQEEVIPIIYSPYDMDFILNEIEKYKVLPIFINDNSIYIGPFANKGEYLENFIKRLKANNTMINKKMSLVKKKPNKIYYNMKVIKENERLLSVAIQKLLDLNSPNEIIVIKNNNISSHSFQPFFEDYHLSNGQDIMDAVDSELGIITELKTESLKSKGVDIYVSVSTTTDYSIYNPNMFAQSNSGAGFDKKTAEYSAVGESIERLAAGCYNPPQNLCAWNELKHNAVHPNRFTLFSEEQYATDKFPYNIFSENTKVNWSKSINLMNGVEEYVPLSLVKLPYRSVKSEERISPAISTGLALGNSKEAAILSGIFEVVERDAFTVSWFLKLPPNKKLKIEEYIQDFQNICSNNYVCNAYDISIDNLFHTILVTIHDKTSNNFMIGAATRFTVEEAVKKAFLEAAQGITYVEMLVRNYKDHKLIEDFDKINSFQKHAAFYSIYPEMRKEVGYILDENFDFEERKDSNFKIEDISNLSKKEMLNIAIETVKNSGFSINYVDITTAELKNLGVEAARILIPGLQSLHGTHTYRFLNTKRLESFSRGSNIEINTYPHPFP